jgi:hypothetical protein
MIKQKSLIGTELSCTIRTIEASQLIRLSHAFYQPNAFLFSKDEKSLDPYAHMPVFLLGNLISLPKIYKALGLNINNILLSRESVISHLPIRAGDSLTIRTFLKDAYEQQASSSPIGFVILESIGEKASDLAFYSERVIAVRGGFSRGHS